MSHSSVQCFISYRLPNPAKTAVFISPAMLPSQKKKKVARQVSVQQVLPRSPKQKRIFQNLYTLASRLRPARQSCQIPPHLAPSRSDTFSPLLAPVEQRHPTKVEVVLASIPRNSYSIMIEVVCAAHFKHYPIFIHSILRVHTRPSSSDQPDQLRILLQKRTRHLVSANLRIPNRHWREVLFSVSVIWSASCL